MKKAFILVLPLLLITSCNETQDKPVDPVTPVDETTLFNNFETKLKELEGHVSSSTTSLERTTVYKSGDYSLVQILTDENEKVRYTYNDSYVVEANGTCAFLDDDGVTVSSSSEYTMQITNDSEKFYKVIDYVEDDWDDSSTSIAYTEAGVALNYNIGFAQDDINNIEAMKTLTDTLKYEYSYTNFEGVIEDNKLHYTYELDIYTIYDGGVKAISEKVTYDNTLTIENGLVTKLRQKYSDILYYAEQPLNCMYVTSTTEYTQGEYTEFSGTILPH